MMDTSTFNAAKFAQLEEILCDKRCAPSVKIVAARVYTKYLNADCGHAWVSRDVLAEELGYNGSTVSYAYESLSELGYGTIWACKKKGRGNSNWFCPSFMDGETVVPAQRIVREIKPRNRCEPRAKPLRATLETVAPVQQDSMKEIKPNESRASLASPPKGGERRALSKPRKKDSRQENGERLDDVAPIVTPEEVREVMKSFRASLKATEEGEETTVVASMTTARRRQEANWQREVAAVAQQAARRGNGKWKQGAAEHSLEHASG